MHSANHRHAQATWHLGRCQRFPRKRTENWFVKTGCPGSFLTWINYILFIKFIYWTKHDFKTIILFILQLNTFVVQFYNTPMNWKKGFSCLIMYYKIIWKFLKKEIIHLLNTHSNVPYKNVISITFYFHVFVNMILSKFKDSSVPLLKFTHK